MYIRRKLVTAAAFKPLEREYIKIRPELRLASTTDDRVIDDLIMSAIEAYEGYTNGVLCLSTWDLYFDEFPTDEIETPGPLSSVASITYSDSAGASQTFASTNYSVDTADLICGRIALISGASWPATVGNINDVVVRIIAGYANPNAIPQRVKDGLLLKIQESYYGTDLQAAYEACWQQNRRIPV